MENYPQLENWHPRDQLLFDVGYSWALIMRVRAVLKEIAECEDYPVEVGEMIEAIEDFQEHRLKLRNTIYDNAEVALDLDRRLAVLEKIVTASDRVMLSRIPSSELEGAIREARELYERK